MQPPSAPPAIVHYRVALWRLTIEDARQILFDRPWKILVASGVAFVITVTLAWMAQGESIMSYLVWPLLIGVGSVAVCYLGTFLALLLYGTPKKMCQLKQEDLDKERLQFATQLERQRIKFKSDILTEKAATQKAMDERDQLRRLLDTSPGPGSAL